MSTGSRKRSQHNGVLLDGLPFKTRAEALKAIEESSGFSWAALDLCVGNFLEAVRMVSRERLLAKTAKELERKVAVIFKRQGRLFIAQFAKYKNLFTEALDQERLKKILDRIEAETGPGMKSVIRETSTKAYGAGIEAGSAIGQEVSFTIKHAQAVKWLDGHAAKMVTEINETTRGYIGGIVKKSVDEGWSYDRTARAISDRYEEFAIGKPQLHIDSRAHLVAVTESAMAYEEGHKAGLEPLRKLGIELEKSWNDMGDDRVSDGCLDNSAADWIPVDELFPSGDDIAPRFPGCRCYIAYRVAGSTGEGEEEVA